MCTAVLAAAVALLSGVLAAIGPAQADTTPADLIVGSFNVKNPHTTSGAPWSQRLPVIVRDIKEEWLDVVAVQEIYRASDREDFLSYLQTNGRPDYVMWPDANDSDGYDNRFVYRTSKVEFVRGGTLKYSKQVAGDSLRWMDWGLFKLKANGHHFFFASTHLAPGDDYVDQKQWEQLIAEVTRRNADPKAPVIVVGDFNTSKFQIPANTMLANMRAAGYGDVLGQVYKTYSTYKQRAVTQIDVRVNSFNDYDPVVAHHMVGAGRVGNNVDWVFAWNSLQVPRWRTVIHQKNGVLTSPIPSDHNLVTARLKLP